MLQLFIPKTKTVDGIPTSSVPYKCKKGEDLFLGDVIEVEIKDDDNLETRGIKEHYVVTFSEGQIIGATNLTNIYIELHDLPQRFITNLGSGFGNPELLEKLTK
jgi:hypothetical protein